jgi:hypothetical protein
MYTDRCSDVPPGVFIFSVSYTTRYYCARVCSRARLPRVRSDGSTHTHTPRYRVQRGSVTRSAGLKRHHLSTLSPPHRAFCQGGKVNIIRTFRCTPRCNTFSNIFLFNTARACRTRDTPIRAMFVLYDRFSPFAGDDDRSSISKNVFAFGKCIPVDKTHSQR